MEAAGNRRLRLATGGLDAMLQILCSPIDIPQDRSQQTWAKRVSRVDWDYGSATVRMAEQRMTTSYSLEDETFPLQNANEIFSLQPREARHIETC